MCRHRSAYGVDALGHTVAQTDERNFTSYSRFDAAGRQVQAIDATGRTTSYERDGFGRISAVVDGNGVRMVIEYDALGRVLRQGSTEFEYDVRGNRTAQHDLGNGVGHRREMTYDSLGRVSSVTELRTVNGVQREVTTRRSYDMFGNLIVESKGDGATNQTMYGGFAREMGSVDADGRALLPQSARWIRWIKLTNLR